MALLDTCIEGKPLIESFKNAMQEELAAQNTYTLLREKVRNTPDTALLSGIKDELLRRVDEILKDEEEHLGSLLLCLTELEPGIHESIQNGVLGK